MFSLNTTNTKFFVSLFVLSVSLSATIAFSKPSENGMDVMKHPVVAGPGFGGGNNGYTNELPQEINTASLNTIIFKDLNGNLARGTCTALSEATGNCSTAQVVADSGEIIHIGLSPAGVKSESDESVQGPQQYIQIACIWEKGRCIPGNSLDQGEL